MQDLDTSFLHEIFQWVQSTLLTSCLHSMQCSERSLHRSFNRILKQTLLIAAKNKSFQQLFFQEHKNASYEVREEIKVPLIFVNQLTPKHTPVWLIAGNAK